MFLITAAKLKRKPHNNIAVRLKLSFSKGQYSWLQLTQMQRSETYRIVS